MSRSLTRALRLGVAAAAVAAVLPSAAAQALPPTATINSPVENADYFVGQPVPVSYSCSDPEGSITSCLGSQPSGETLDTSSPGVNRFEVDTADSEGNVVSSVVNYRVHPVAGLCRGSSLRLPLNIRFGVANEPVTPCVTATKQDLNVNSITGNPASLLGVLVNPATLLVQANGLLGNSGLGAGSTSASTDLANVSIKVLGLTLALNAVHSDAQSRITSCSTAVSSGSSRIARLSINGAAPIPVGDQALTLPLGIGTLYLNQRAVSGTTITMRTLFLDLPGTALDVILGESVAGAVCGPLPVEAP